MYFGIIASFLSQYCNKKMAQKFIEVETASTPIYSSQSATSQTARKRWRRLKKPAEDIWSAASCKI
jgi:hypothetical protein